MPCQYLFADIVVILLLPYANCIIVASAYQFSGLAGEPLDKFYILGVPLQNWIAYVIVGNIIELPYPDIFVTAAWGDFMVIWAPAYTFYLIYMAR